MIPYPHIFLPYVWTWLFTLFKVNTVSLSHIQGIRFCSTKFSISWEDPWKRRNYKFYGFEEDMIKLILFLGTIEKVEINMMLEITTKSQVNDLYWTQHIWKCQKNKTLHFLFLKKCKSFKYEHNLEPKNQSRYVEI